MRIGVRTAADLVRRVRARAEDRRRRAVGPRGSRWPAQGERPVVADDGGEPSGYGNRQQPASRPAAVAKAAPKSSTGFDNMDDDIPF